MAYATPEPKKILALMPDGHDRRFYPYPKENITPKGINEIVRSAPNFGFIVQNCEAIYGNATGGHFTPARRQAEG